MAYCLYTLLANRKIMTFETYYQHIKNDLEAVNIKCPTKAYIRRLWQMAYTVEQAVHSIIYDE